MVLTVGAGHQDQVSSDDPPGMKEEGESEEEDLDKEAEQAKEDLDEDVLAHTPGSYTDTQV